MSNFFENMFGSAPRSPIAELVVSSTDPLLMGPDWSANLEVAELINTYESDGAKEAVKALKKRLGQEPRVLALTLTLLESLMKNCSASFHVEVASKDFMTELLKTAQNKKTSVEAQRQIVELVGSWAADEEFKRSPQLVQFGTSHEQLTAQGPGRPQMSAFSPLVAEHGDHEFVASAAPQLALAPTTSTRGTAHHVATAEPLGQVRLLVAPPAVPRGPLGASLRPGDADAPLSVVEDDALPGVTEAAATPGSVRAPDAVEADDFAADELAADEEEHALQVALAASLHEARHNTPRRSPPRGSAPEPAQLESGPLAQLESGEMGEMGRLTADVATLQGNVALFAECLAASDSAGDTAQNQVLAELLPGLQESQPRVLRLLEGGDVSDEALVVRLLEVHEQLSTCLTKYAQLRGCTTAPADAPPVAAPAATATCLHAEAAAGSAGDLLGDLALADDVELTATLVASAPADLLGIQHEPTLTLSEELMQQLHAPAPPGGGGAGRPGSTQADAHAMLPSTPPPPMPPPPMPPPSMPPPSTPPPSTPPPSTPPPPTPPPAVQILDL